MDTHIAPHPEPEDRTASLSARLPGEPLEADEHGGADEPGLAAPGADERLATQAPTRRKRRLSLLLGVAIVSLGIAGGSTFLVSPYNHVVPVPGMPGLFATWRLRPGSLCRHRLPRPHRSPVSTCQRHPTRSSAPNSSRRLLTSSCRSC